MMANHLGRDNKRDASQPARREDMEPLITPGQVGKGIPTLSTLLLDRTTRAIKLAGRGEVKAAIFSQMASLAEIRTFYSPFKSPNEIVTCPLCGWEGPCFCATASWRGAAFNSVCPGCDSRSRHRGLYYLLSTQLKGILRRKLLYIAPEKNLLGSLRRISHATVVTCDLSMEGVDLTADIRQLPFPDGSFESVMCNHVLEHVPDDGRAIVEIARVLSRGGVALLTVPGGFPDNATVQYAKPDSNGHYRHYGLDLIQELRKSFSEVREIDMGALAPREWSVRKNDYAFVSTKG